MFTTLLVVLGTLLLAVVAVLDPNTDTEHREPPMIEKDALPSF